MKKILNKILVNHSLIYKFFLYIITVFLIVYLFPKGGQFKYEFQKGKPWQYENYYAPFNFSIQKSPEEIEQDKEQIKATSKQFYDYNEQIVSQVKQVVNQKVNDYFNQSANSGVSTKKVLLRTVNLLLNKLYETGYINDADYEQLNRPIITLKTGNKIREIEANKLLNSDEINKMISDKIGIEPLSDDEQAIRTILNDNLQPNVSFNKILTDRNLAENLSKISYTKGLVAVNQRIILKGDIVEGEKLAILNSLKQEYESQVWSKSNYNWIVFGYTILVALAFLMLFLFVRKYRNEIFENNTKVTFIFFNIIFIVLLVTLTVKFDAKYVYIVPIVILPLVLKAFFDARLGLFTHVLTVLLLGFIVPNSFEFIFLQIIAGIVTILTISELYKRANLFISVLQITAVYYISYLAFSIIQEGNAKALIWEKFLYFALNGGATLFVLPLIYIFEKLFGLISDESLKELSNTNNKLLRELAEKAPGTFQHSLQVANLAEASANEVQANAMLVRTGALYHDIGKMDNPMYFTENQSTNVNPHHELSPKDSAAIIINHVIKGIELAKKNHLPDRIIDFIRTHHGTTLVYYFYKMEENQIGEAVDEKPFQYPGPIPFSKETAILMMCDSVEAASRSLKEPTAQMLDDLVEKIITKQLEGGQFMNADITFKELNTIKKVLKKKLKNIYHLRIEYPE
ncbi:MAG: HD family phosphohydrolase [Lutibacter sp.]